MFLFLFSCSFCTPRKTVNKNIFTERVLTLIFSWVREYNTVALRVEKNHIFKTNHQMQLGC